MVDIHIKQLLKKFGDKTAVFIPEYHIRQGEILGLVGNNGAGKTTFFRLLLDLIKADDGLIELEYSCKNDEEKCCNKRIVPSQSEDWKLFTGAYIDDGFLIDFLTPEEYFAFIATINGMEKESKDNVLSFFQPLMNGEILGQGKYIRNFSAGNKQKIGIISAFIHQPQLVILDEPFNFLDPKSQNMLKKLITEYHDATKATIIISSHNLQHTIDISMRIALMEDGAIIKDLNNDNETVTQELQSYFEV